MKIALAQLNIKWESKSSNFDRASALTKKAAGEQCDIIVFPEMFNTGFSMNIPAIAENEVGETASFLSKTSKNFNINLIAGYAAKSSDDIKGRNIAVVYNRKGELTATYSKMHPFSFANEDQYYVAGNDIVTFDVDAMTSGIFICYDLRFPEVFRKIAKKVQTIFVIANWPSTRKEHWISLLKARAIENQCFIIGVNRTGEDANGISYSGDSLIYSPSGNKICYGQEMDELLICEINTQEVIETRAKFPFLNDIRPSI